jgi:hypothetical protein
MRCRRRIVAVVLIAVFAFAVAIPAGGGDVLAFLMPVWLEFQPDVPVVVTAPDSLPAAEQPLSLRSVASFRGPPAALFA